MDVREMTFENGAFDVVIDKACMDCLFCGIFIKKNVKKALSEIHRVLQNNGIYVMISNSPP